MFYFEIYNFELLQMNYAHAVKRPKTRAFIFDTIKLNADTEFGAEASQDIVQILLQRFELEYVFNAIQKVFHKII